MPKFLIFKLKTGKVAEATKLTESDYRKADNGEYLIIFTGDNNEQYVRKSWSHINKHKSTKGQL